MSGMGGGVTIGGEAVCRKENGRAGAGDLRIAIADDK